MSSVICSTKALTTALANVIIATDRNIVPDVSSDDHSGYIEVSKPL